jgi:acrylyl-CoA reductase (NADPH)
VPNTFRAIWIASDDGKFKASLRDVPVSELPPNDVLIHVEYSSLNYKDGLAVTGKPGVIRRYPMIPGIDLAGTVVESRAPEFKPGDRVAVTGCGLSETEWGGYAEMARMKAEDVVPVPAGVSTAQAMAIGTAGFTAMQAIMALERNGLKTGAPELVVTGAGGGVGSVAVALLARLGYRVVGSTGRTETHDYLRQLGAADIIDRSVLSTPSKKPMETERWGGAVDTVGGETLAGLMRTAARNSSIAVCGLAGGPALNATVFPLILRGVNLLGINSVFVSNADRRAVWARLEKDLDLALLDRMTQHIALTDVSAWGEKILAGQVRGRVVVDIKS